MQRLVVLGNKQKASGSDWGGSYLDKMVPVNHAASDVLSCLCLSKSIPWVLRFVIFIEMFPLLVEIYPGH